MEVQQKHTIWITFDKYDVIATDVVCAPPVSATSVSVLRLPHLSCSHLASISSSTLLRIRHRTLRTSAVEIRTWRQYFSNTYRSLLSVLVSNLCFLLPLVFWISTSSLKLPTPPPAPCLTSAPNEPVHYSNGQVLSLC